MNADYIHHRCVVSPRSGQRTASHLLLISTALCLVVPGMTGCQSGNAHQAAVEPHYAQLEQVCFGYEPTVWRTMSGQCEQAARLIPDEVVQVPVAPPAQATTESALPTETGPGPSGLEGVPEPGDRLPAVMNPAPEPTTPEGTETPEAAPAETPPPVQPPMENPPVAPAPPQEQPPVENPPAAAAPPQEPIREAPSADVPPAVAPETPPASSATGPKFSRREARKPVTLAAQQPTEPATNAVASGLFRSVEQALVVKPSAAKVAEQRPANKNSAIGLARFISY